jgi:hypothetical protein
MSAGLRSVIVVREILHLIDHFGTQPNELSRRRDAAKRESGRLA